MWLACHMAMDHSKWRKLIKDIRPMTGMGVSG